MEEQGVHLSSVGGNLAIAFPALVELYFEKGSPKSKERNFDILKKRFGLSGAGVYTLEDIGTYYDVTRERVRQIEAKSIKELGFLLQGKIKFKDLAMSAPVRTEYLCLLEVFGKSSLLILEEEVDSIFLNRYDEKLSSGYRDLFMEVSGFVKMPQSVPGFRGARKKILVRVGPI